MSVKFLAATLLSLGIAISGCSSEPTAVSEVFAGAEANQVASVSPEVFADVVDKTDVVLLDVRSPEKYSEGHIDGALNLSAESGDFVERVQSLPAPSAYLVYCQSGPKTEAAVEIMERIGATPIITLEGGINAWEGADLSTSQ